MPRKRGNPRHERRERSAPTTSRAPDAPRSTERRGYTLVLLGIVLVAAAALRFNGLAYRDLWFDELGAVLMAASGDLWQSEGGNPPLFFALLRGAIHLLGDDVASARVLSALAGVAAVAAIYWVASELELPALVRVWGMVLFACSPLQLYYAQESRAYALLVLLLLLALATFLRALGTGSWSWWAAHAASLVAGLYTHNMMIPMAGAFWAAALVLRPGAREWRCLAIAHGLALLAYAPWLPRLFEQASGDRHRWIGELIDGTSSVALLAGTFEAFNIGGRLPAHLQFPAGHGTAVWSVLLFGLAALMAVAAVARSRPTADFVHLRRSFCVLAIFVVWPMAFLCAYTWLEGPLYVVGRYDLPAHPAYLLVIGMGLHEMSGRFRTWGRVATWLPAAALMGLTGCALAPKLTSSTDSPDHLSRRMAALLSAWAAPSDLIIALDNCGPLVRYVILSSRLPVRAEKFPAERLDHLDVVSLNRRVLMNLTFYRQQAADLATRARGRRIWLVEGSGYGPLDQPQNAYEALKRTLMTELRQHRSSHGHAGDVLQDVTITRLDPL